MPQFYSFKTETQENEECFHLDAAEENWILGSCVRVIAYLHQDRVAITYDCVPDIDIISLTLGPDAVASKTAFLEWQSRLIDCAKDQFKFKGNVDKMFGPESYSNWIPFYKDDISPSNAYMQGMGLVDLTKED